jgi:tryptophan-rich sensory protein
MRTDQLQRINKKAQEVSDKLNWWQVGLITLGVSFLGGLSAIMSKKKQRKLYNKELKQAPWAPPSWVFSPAWTFNNFFLIKALKDIIKNDKLDSRRSLLYLQAAIWTIYFTFGYVYFKKKSPVLAAIWTKTDAGLAIASLILAAKKDKKLALNYIPLALWTLFAGSVADYQALKNPDEVLGTGPALS